ncbi:TRAP transporter large permease [Ammoniphilus sp. 3BR4]|uniref:TRAP transporter large permease n=1 Tax=Ammoniphilus sp. 3BR4 TaxID=3158265 RepID=UPI003465B01B
MALEVLVWFSLFGLIAIGVPIFVALGMATFIVLVQSDIPLNIIPLDLYKVSEMFPLIAIPCFILAGAIMERVGISQQIVQVASMLVGRIKGGLGLVTILGCVFFAAMIGSGPATVAAMGSLMIPSMVRAGYSKQYASGVCCTGGTLGILIPPSNPMIIYGVVGNVSIASLFAGGFIPGALVALCLMLTAYLIARRSGFKGSNESYTTKEVLQTIMKNFWSLFSPVLILGGIYTGVFTPVEASVVAVVYALLIGFLVTRQLTLKSIRESMRMTNLSTAIIIIVVGISILFGRFLTMYQVPQKIADSVLHISSDPFIVLMLICVFLFILGMFMETLATIVILVPVLLPLVTSLGIDPIHFGIIIVMTNEVALLTPPLGVNLFVAKSLTDLSLEQIAKSVLPYIVTLILCVIVVARFEEIVLFLPKLIYGG